MWNNIFKLCDIASNEMINELDTIKQSEMKYYITVYNLHIARYNTRADGQFEIDKHALVTAILYAFGTSEFVYDVSLCG